MAQVRIVVGAARDRSVDEVFNGIVNTAKRARSQVAAEAKAGAGAEASAWKEAQRELARMDRERTAEANKAAKARLKAGNDAAKEQEREAKRAAKSIADTEREAIRETGRERDRAAREELSRLRQIEAEQKKASRQRAAAVSSGIATGGRALRFGASVMGDLARATGVKTDLGSIMSQNADLETASVNLSNSGYQAGDKRNGQRVDPAELQKFAFEKGNATGQSANDVIGALSAFTAKTGDLKTGMESFEKMAQLARATGSDVNDMADAMGDVSNNLGDIPDKANVLNAVMRQIAGQGKLGAVEVKDLASQMAKVASAAGSLEGDAAKNIGMLGAFAQEARQRGGAASAGQAATSVAAMVNTFKTPARVAAFKAQGIDVYNQQGQIRDPKQIMMEALAKAGTDPVAFKKMYANVAGGRAVEGFASVYRQAYAGASGSTEDRKAVAAQAVEDEFKRLERATMEETEVMESFKRSMDTGQAQANVFNNEIQQTTQQLQKELTPALIALAPEFVRLTSAVAGAAVALLGTEGSKSGATDKSQLAVDTDLAATNKQIAHGTIYQEQIDKNKADAADLQKKVDAQKADAADKKDMGIAKKAVIGGVGGIFEAATDPSKSWAQRAMLFTPQGLAGAAAGGIAKFSKLNAQNAAADEAGAGEAEGHLKELNDTNKTVADLLKNGTLKVQVVSAPPPAPKATTPTVSQLGE